MNNKLPQILGFSLVLDIILLDQISKWAITELILRPKMGMESVGLVDWVMNAPERVMSGVSTAILPSFDLTMVWNEGVSFGLLQNAGIWPLVIMAAIISLVLGHWMVKTNSKTEAISFGMIIGGAIGNIIDRFRFGGVADFFDVYVGTYHWPAFNIADSAITIGVVILLCHSFMTRNEGE